MDDIKMIGLKDASDATSSLPANCGMYYSIHYDSRMGRCSSESMQTATITPLLRQSP